MKSLLNKNDTIGLISCSNGLDINMIEKIDELISILSSMQINVIKSKSLFKDKFGITYDAKIRAKELMNLYINEDIKIIFDLSGGDLCNEILDYLDYDIISKSQKPFFGYSDLTVVLNALLKQSNTVNYNYQLRNLIKENSIKQINNFKNSILEGIPDLFNFNYKWIQGSSMSGTVIGGNIRCFLKLAGTKFMPDFKNKILFLEALSGDVNKISTFLTQYKQIGAFNNISGILLGTFTELEKDPSSPKIEDIIIKIIDNPNIPIAKTDELGHGSNSKCIGIGKDLYID
ncbi:LD-carboxypeptidase [Clostridium sp. D46t1_190503_E9]|uniref:LD-carboxypeptidase n=1 Tax=Clostridium sp. D46t1_190503_E9 TaxID=2787137 RepID=UPI00189A985C|nr:LD-carboxypeptidase [Clostridium sp. D46t1_190503_E9]